MENIENQNPTPAANKPKITNGLYFEMLRQYKNFDGRLSRNEYWFFVLINFIVSIILSFLWNPLGVLSLLCTLVLIASASVRRIHDLNKEFWFVLIPLYNLYLLVQKGTNVDQANIFGPSLEEKNIKTNTVFILIFITFTLFIGKNVFQQYQIKKAKEKWEALYTSNDTAKINTELEKQNQISLQEVEKAQTLEEIIIVFRNAPRGSQSSMAAALKWIDLCQTSKQLKDANDNFSENSEAMAKTLVKWKEISKKEIDQAQTIQQAKDIYENAPNDNDLKTIIYNKWNELSLQKVDQIQTVKEAKELHDNSPVGSQARTKILEKWKELSKKEIQEVQGFDNTKTLFSNLPNENNLKNDCILKWISFCQTVKEIKEVYTSAVDKGDSQRLALVKWKELAGKEIDQIQKVDDARILYGNLPDDDKLKSNLTIKWISLCQNSKEIKEVYLKTLINSEERKSAFEKWNSLSLQEIEKAKTLEEVREVYNNTPENSQARTVATEKLKELQ